MEEMVKELDADNNTHPTQIISFIFHHQKLQFIFLFFWKTLDSLVL